MLARIRRIRGTYTHIASQVHTSRELPAARTQRTINSGRRLPLCVYMRWWWCGDCGGELDSQFVVSPVLVDGAIQTRKQPANRRAELAVSHEYTIFKKKASGRIPSLEAYSQRT